MAKYLSVLTFLTSLGPKLQSAWPLILQAFEQIEALLATVQKLSNLLRPESAQPAGLEIYEPSPDELAAEEQIGQLLAANGAQNLIDFSRIRNIVRLAKEYGLLDWLLSQITKAATGV